MVERAPRHREPASPDGAEAFETFSSLPLLYQGWERVRRNAGGPGADGVTIATYTANVGDRLISLHRDLRSGHYVPGPLRRVDIPKPRGGVRTLAIPCIADRVVQTAASIVLAPLLEPEMDDASFAYRAGRSVKQAVARVAYWRRRGYGWVVDCDILHYFDSVPHDRLIQRFGQSIPDGLARDVLRLWLESFSDNRRGLPQGAPISPLLANLYLTDVDKAMASNFRLVRFADDFVLLCRSKPSAEAALEKIGRLLDERGLSLHADKTRIVGLDTAFTFLGKMFVRCLVFDDPAKTAKPGASPVRPAAVPAGTDDADDGATPHSPGLRVLHLVRPGRRLTLRNRSLTVTEEGVEKLAFPPQHLQRIELWPGTEADADALRLAVRDGAEVAFVAADGSTLGRLAAPAHDHAGLHLEQARHALDPDLRLDLARRVVEGRLRNQATLLKRINRTRNDPALADAAARIDHMARRLETAFDVSELMGFEGAAAALYWPAWGSTLKAGWEFDTRRRRPATDPANGLLSLVSTLLHRDLAALAGRHGLHPGLGALHTARDGHPGLLSDLVEEFRAPLIEAFVRIAIGNGTVVSEQLVTGIDRQARLVPEGYARLVSAWQRWLARTVKSPRSGRSMRWRRLMEEQVAAWRAHLEGGEPYRPYRMDY
ncbi:MAG: CRISPR-associated endonuclease Cas1 [Enhydrobacter sp.]|nr:MAG: CRISPR-associated endonuclease Cas1 [Enhydrobacter sp.]